jgi:hypothetical protein
MGSVDAERMNPLALMIRPLALRLIIPSRSYWR